MLGEFDIAVVQPKAIKSQALSDLLAHFPSQYEEIIPDSIPGEFQEEACSISVEEGNGICTLMVLQLLMEGVLA